MDLTGCSLKEALEIIEKNGNKIINIRKVLGTNKKFNNLYRPYVIRVFIEANYITLFISYY